MTCAREAADVFQAHRDELGFVNQAQCQEKCLYTERRDGRVVGAALANHCVRKPQTTLYELAVLPEYRRQGIATKLIARLERDTPHEKIVAKCPVDLSANEFYQAHGWKCERVEDGKNRDLNVWVKRISSVDIITTGRPDLTEYAGEYGWLIGTRLDKLSVYERAGVSPEFIDLHWEDPDRDKLLSAVIKHRPKYVVAGDYNGQNHATINDFANTLRQYADNIIIVPHNSGEIEKVPDWALVGYSTPTAYEGTDAPIWEYYGRDVHVLGGTMAQIELVVNYLRNEIVSVDTNTMHRDATQFGEYWSKSNPQRKKIAQVGNTIREAYENGVLNMTYAFEEWGLL